MPETAKVALEKAIRDLHGCDSTWIEAVPVAEIFQGQTVWEGTVQVFELHGHPTAKRCYAWSHVTKGRRRRFVAVLHQGPVDSPEKAVRASIVQEAREKNNQVNRPRQCPRCWNTENISESPLGWYCPACTHTWH